MHQNTWKIEMGIQQTVSPAHEKQELLVQHDCSLTMLVPSNFLQQLTGEATLSTSLLARSADSTERSDNLGGSLQTCEAVAQYGDLGGASISEQAHQPLLLGVLKVDFCVDRHILSTARSQAQRRPLLDPQTKDWWGYRGHVRLRRCALLPCGTSPAPSKRDLHQHKLESF